MREVVVAGNGVVKRSRERGFGSKAVVDRYEDSVSRDAGEAGRQDAQSTRQFAALETRIVNGR